MYKNRNSNQTSTNSQTWYNIPIIKQTVRTMKPKNIVWIGLATASLTACATPYGPAGEFGGFQHGGYTDRRISDNTQIVYFEGNSANTCGQIRTYLIYRCAQVTLNSGYDYFIITSMSGSQINTNVTTRDSYNNYVTNPPKLYTTYYKTSDFQSASYTRSSATRCNVYPHGSIAVIKMFQGVKPAGVPTAYDARDITAQLGPATF